MSNIQQSVSSVSSVFQSLFATKETLNSISLTKDEALSTLRATARGTKGFKPVFGTCPEAGVSGVIGVIIGTAVFSLEDGEFLSSQEDVAAFERGLAPSTKRPYKFLSNGLVSPDKFTFGLIDPASPHGVSMDFVVKEPRTVEELNLLKAHKDAVGEAKAAALVKLQQHQGQRCKFSVYPHGYTWKKLQDDPELIADIAEEIAAAITKHSPECANGGLSEIQFVGFITRIQPSKAEEGSLPHVGFAMPSFSLGVRRLSKGNSLGVVPSNYRRDVSDLLKGAPVAPVAAPVAPKIDVSELPVQKVSVARAQGKRLPPKASKAAPSTTSAPTSKKSVAEMADERAKNRDYTGYPSTNASRESRKKLRLSKALGRLDNETII